MPRKQRTEIFSIFGQIEAAAAEAMIAKHGLHKIDARDIPPSASTNEAGQAAQFAVVMPREHLAEFEQTIANLRA